MVMFLFIFLYVQGYIDDTDSLFNSSIFAVPPVFGFSQEEGLEKFPNFYYPPCAEKFSDLPPERLGIDYRRNTVEFNCPVNSTPFVVVPTDTEIQLPDPKDIKFHTKKIEFGGNVTVGEWAEYAIGSCDKNEFFGIDEWFLKPRFKDDVYFSRIKKKKVREKPMIILFISADSFSRRHFYRKLKNTVRYFNQLEDFMVFDFKMHNIIGTDTADNQIFVFGNLNHNSQGRESDTLGDSALWNIMSDKNFITLWGTDGCSSNVPKVLGNRPEVDHIIATFFCATQHYSKYTANKYHKFEQRCLGPKMSHSYLMNYTQEFVNQYSKANLWIYNHFTAGHETSGQHSQTLDSDLEVYLRWFIDTHSASSELIIFVNGDHGMRYGEHMTKTKSIQEYRLPASFIIAKKSLLLELNAVENLSHNSWRLNSKPDLRESMIFLALWQNGEKYFKDSEKAVNLFAEKIDDRRSCDEAGILPWYCCYVVLEDGLVEGKLSMQTIDFVVEFVMYQVNSELLAQFGGKAEFYKECVVKKVFSKEVKEGLMGFVVRVFVGCAKIKAKTLNLWVYLTKEKIGSEKVVRNLYFTSFPVLVGFEKFYCKVVHYSWNDII